MYSIEPFLNYPGVCTDDRKITTEAFVRVSWHNVGKLGVPIHLLLSRHLVHCIYIIMYMYAHAYYNIHMYNKYMYIPVQAYALFLIV